MSRELSEVAGEEPGLDRRAFLKGSSVAAVGTALAAAGFAVSAEAAAAVPPAEEPAAPQDGAKDLMAGWLAV